jgi:hypothetical protein
MFSFRWRVGFQECHESQNRVHLSNGVSLEITLAR